MAGSMKSNIEDAGQKISETATKVGHRISEKAEEAADWAKEKTHQAGNRISEATQKFENRTGLASSEGVTGSRPDIKEHMGVFASCGTMVGKVDHVQGNSIKLTKNDSPDGQHHLIPMSWVTRVDSGVHLDREHMAVQRDWQST
jgi:hypothetical protein